MLFLINKNSTANWNILCQKVFFSSLMIWTLSDFGLLQNWVDCTSQFVICIFFAQQNLLKITNSIEINVMDGHQDTPVLHRSNYRARGRVQSWWGEWKIFKKLAWQNLLKLTYTIEINVMDDNQDTPVLQRSNYRAGGQMQSNFQA